MSARIIHVGCLCVYVCVKHPKVVERDYAYVWVVEDDVAFTGDIIAMVEALQDDSADLITHGCTAQPPKYGAMPARAPSLHRSLITPSEHDSFPLPACIPLRVVMVYIRSTTDVDTRVINEPVLSCSVCFSLAVFTLPSHSHTHRAYTCSKHMAM